MSKRILTLALTSLLAGCVSMEIEVNLPEGRTQAARFYFGDGHVGDLFILGGRNHYGRLRYPINLVRLPSTLGRGLVTILARRHSKSFSKLLRKVGESIEAAGFGDV